MQTLIDKIIEKRKQLGITQRAAADHLNISRESLCNAEKARRDLKQHEIQGLCELLNIDPITKADLD